MESNTLQRPSKLKVFLDTYMYYVLINKSHRQCAANRMKMEFTKFNIESNSMQFYHS